MLERALRKRGGFWERCIISKLRRIGTPALTIAASLLANIALSLMVTDFSNQLFHPSRSLGFSCAAVTLRGDRMFEFLDRLVSVVLPRVRDFRGVSTRSFDGRGNYTMGLRDQLIFPEIPYEKVDKIRGMNVTIVTTARNDDEARELLKQLGVPFRQ